MNKSIFQKNPEWSADSPAQEEGRCAKTEGWIEASKRERFYTAVACWLAGLTFAGPGQWLSGRTVRGILWFAGELALISIWLVVASRGSGRPLATATGILILYHLASWVEAARCGWRFHKMILGSSVSRILVMAGLVFLAPLPAAIVVYKLGQVWMVREYDVSEASMAPALVGQHAKLACEACGYNFAIGLPASSAGYVIPERLVCPMCGNHSFGAEREAFLPGDRILSSKQLLPKRWDLLLFRSPTDLTTLFLKRAVGFAGEELEIIDGEIFINSKLASKPALAREEMWLPVMDTRFRGRKSHRAKLQWRPMGKGNAWCMDRQGWLFNSSEQSQESLGLIGELSDRLIYNLNSLAYIEPEPIHDVRLRVSLSELHGAGELSLVWEHKGRQAKGSLQANGQVSLVILRSGRDQTSSVQTKHVGRDIEADSVLMLIIRDGYAYLYLGREQLCRAAVGEFEAKSVRGQMPESCQIRIAASNCRGRIGRIQLDRDVHYRAVNSQSVKIGPRQYYVLGDNSAVSSDSRLGWRVYPGLTGWDDPTMVPAEFTEGVVTCVYWPLRRIRSFR